MNDISKMIEKKSCFIFDLDGTVYIGDEFIESSVDFIKRYWDKKTFFFMTNNTSHSPEYYKNKLNNAGINVSESSIITPFKQIRDYYHKNSQRVFLIANKSVTEFLHDNLPDIKFILDYEECESVLMTYDTEITYKKIQSAINLLNNPKVKFIASHPDKLCPSENGLIPDVGSFCDMIFTACSRKPDIIFGKPDPAMVSAKISGFKKEDVLVVGDRLYTDKTLAENLEVDFLLLLTGETKEDKSGDSNYFYYCIHDLGKIHP